MTEFQKILADSARRAGFELTDLQLQQFDKYYEMLVETNKVMNLTALTEPQDVQSNEPDGANRAAGRGGKTYRRFAYGLR